MSAKTNMILLAAVAADYLRANPGTTVSQLRQAFPMPPTDANRIVRAARSINPPANAETTEAAIKWAIKTNAGFGKIRDRFGIGAMESRRIAKVAKNERKIIDADKINRLEEAKTYALKNRNIGCKEIAAKFSVSFWVLQRWNEENRPRTDRTNNKKALPTPPTLVPASTDRKRRRFCGMVDGQWVPVDRIPQRVEPKQYSYEVV